MPELRADIQAAGPRFDRSLCAWILSRHADVTAALSHPRLMVPGDAGAGATAHGQVRDAAARALSSARLAAWRVGLESSARRMAGGLRAGQPVDLVRDFAQPWSVHLAVTVTGAPAGDADRFVRLARRVFLAAAHATGPGFTQDAASAAAELAHGLSTAGASADAQAIVALTQTLPCMLAGAWHALLDHPEETARLRSQPALLPRAVEELLRHASPSRAVFRQAVAEVELGGVRIAEGDRVILALAAANRDPARFPDPDRLDLGRRAAGHVAFGRGAHGCPGAPLIRLAVAVATEALLATAAGMDVVGEIEWTGGFAIRAPASLPVVLRREPVAHAHIAD